MNKKELLRYLNECLTDNDGVPEEEIDSDHQYGYQQGYHYAIKDATNLVEYLDDNS